MLLKDVQKKKKRFLNYIDSDYFKMIFTDECVSKVENRDVENGFQQGRL